MSKGLNMRCPICHTTDKWENVDEYRDKPEDMCMCTECGFISYPSRYQTKDEIIRYYKEEYRGVPDARNLYQGQQKLYYHESFLRPYLDKWIEDKRQNIVVCDVGSAVGMLPNWLKQYFAVKGKQEIETNGVELTTSFVRNAFHMFGLKSEDEFNTNKKYDLITSYKSLEHILDPDVELKKYIDCLKDDGYLYISVPYWFEELNNFGEFKFSLAGYYHPNHINTWTRKHFEGLIECCGGEVVDRNETYYGVVVLVKRNKDKATEDRSKCYEDPKKIKEYLKTIHEAADAYDAHKFERAIELWPNFPLAHKSICLYRRKMIHEKGFDYMKEGLDRAIAACPQQVSLLFEAADWFNKYDKQFLAIEYLEEFDKKKPHQAPTYFLFINIYKCLAELATKAADRVKYYIMARDAACELRKLSEEHRGEASTIIMFCNAQIPTPWEVEENAK